MKLLLDANISWRLAAKLSEHFPGTIHVDKVRTAPPLSDIEIWNYASENTYLIVTNDEDFLNFVNLKGFPPKVIMLRMGNQSNDFVLEVLIKHKAEIEALILSSQLGLLQIY